MRVEVFAGEEGYLVRLPGSGGARRWQRQDGAWVSSPGAVPPGAARVEVGALPADLQEELLAFLARAQALGNRAWSEP